MTAAELDAVAELVAGAVVAAEPGARVHRWAAVAVGGGLPLRVVLTDGRAFDLVVYPAP